MRFSVTHMHQINCRPLAKGVTIRLKMALEFPGELFSGIDLSRSISSLAISVPPGIPERFYEPLWYRTGLNAGVHRAVGEKPFLPDLNDVVFTYEDLELDVDWDTVEVDEIECYAEALEHTSYKAARDLIDQVLQSLRDQ